MDLVDAFTQEAIEAHDTNVGGDMETELKEIITQIFTTNEINWSEDILNVAMLCFVAGRTYEMDSFTLEISRKTAKEFIDFLVEKGST